MTQDAKTPIGPLLIGTWPARCVQRAFVDGAMWWLWFTQGATPFGSERDDAEAEAVTRYGEPKPDERTYTADEVRELMAAAWQEGWQAPIGWDGARPQTTIDRLLQAHDVTRTETR